MFNSLLNDNLVQGPLLFLIMVWVLPWKGVALWKSSKNGHKKWFIALLLINTLAILEIVYIFYFDKKAQKKRDLSLS